MRARAGQEKRGNAWSYLQAAYRERVGKVAAVVVNPAACEANTKSASQLTAASTARIFRAPLTVFRMPYKS